MPIVSLQPLEASRERVDALRRKMSNQAPTISPEGGPHGNLDLKLCEGHTK